MEHFVNGVRTLLLWAASDMSEPIHLTLNLGVRSCLDHDTFFSRLTFQVLLIMSVGGIQTSHSQNQEPPNCGSGTL